MEGNIIALLLAAVVAYQSIFAKHHINIARISCLAFALFICLEQFGGSAGIQTQGYIKGFAGVSFAIFVLLALSWLTLDIRASKKSS